MLPYRICNVSYFADDLFASYTYEIHAIILFDYSYSVILAAGCFLRTEKNDGLTARTFYITLTG